MTIDQCPQCGTPVLVEEFSQEGISGVSYRYSPRTVLEAILGPVLLDQIKHAGRLHLGDALTYAAQDDLFDVIQTTLAGE